MSSLPKATYVATNCPYSRTKERSRKRNDAEKKLVDQAKALLMERNNMSEDEAHRYLQKSSMDSGTNLTETAQMILTILNE